MRLLRISAGQKRAASISIPALRRAVSTKHAVRRVQTCLTLRCQSRVKLKPGGSIMCLTSKGQSMCTDEI
ncbi:hypothetical protein VTO73DRAFT_3392 [Trametes versicolor]